MGTPYRRCLRTLYAFYSVWEQAIWETPAVSEAVPDGALRRKMPLLARDLESLGMNPPHVAIPPPRLDCARALGSLYVLEGASLGGRVIERHVFGPLGLSPERGGAFFHGYGELTGAMWRGFGDSLEAFVRREGQAEGMIVGAIACFAALEEWVRTASVHPATAHDATARPATPWGSSNDSVRTCD